MKRKVAKTIWVLLVTLSMMSTAAAACLCDHHQPAEPTAEISCHKETHSEAPSSSADELPAVSGNHVEAVCDCFTYISVPGVPAGHAAKKAVDHDTDAGSSEIRGAGVPNFYAVTPSLDLVTPDSILFTIPRISAPSRAPPRF